jgi:hypothetical protein
LVGYDEPSHKWLGYFWMSQRALAAGPLPMIEKQSCGQFSTDLKKSLVRHYPHFEVRSGTAEGGKNWRKGSAR